MTERPLGTLTAEASTQHIMFTLMLEHGRLLRIVELAFRWHVAPSLFIYGFAKTVQFSPTSGVDAATNTLTGQQLMWAFYGYSLGYAKFLGVVEMLGAGLLLFRRTVLLGCPTSKIIDTDALHPSSIGIFVNWGSGKSSLMKMLYNRYKGSEDILTIHFNGWLFEGYEDATDSFNRSAY